MNIVYLGRWSQFRLSSDNLEQPAPSYRDGALGAELLAAETAYAPSVVDAQFPALSGNRLLRTIAHTYAALNA